MGYENTAREQLDNARDKFSREAVDTSMGQNVAAPRDALLRHHKPRLLPVTFLLPAETT